MPPFLIFATRYPFDTDNEEYLVHITTGTHVAQICWFLLTEARYLPASLLQTGPAPKRRHRRADRGRYRLGYRSGFKPLCHSNQPFFSVNNSSPFHFLRTGLKPATPPSIKLIDRIERVSLRSTDPILLTGPTGAGKSFLAKRIFPATSVTPPVAGKFVAINCATLRGDNAMSTLFGHVKGAFTGAQAARSGLLREADGGVLFLDEIAELGLDEQAMLLKSD